MLNHGYINQIYVDSLLALGTPRQLHGSGAWLLERPVGRHGATDAVASYPLMVCRDWAALEDDLAGVEGLVSFAAVTDPFGDYSREQLQQCFPDVLTPYKKHFVTDLDLPLDRTVSAHHRRNVRFALAHVEIELVQRPQDFAADWVKLYANLTHRHHITGMSAFSEQTLVSQLDVPGLTVFRAVANGETVGMLLWVVSRNVAYYHLAAYSDEGYRRRASFGLFWKAAQHFQQHGLRWLCLGAGPGVAEPEHSGLVRFKSGWSTGTRWAYFGGRIFDRPAYEALSANVSASAGFFPAYRSYV